MSPKKENHFEVRWCFQGVFQKGIINFNFSFGKIFSSVRKGGNRLQLFQLTFSAFENENFGNFGGIFRRIFTLHGNENEFASLKSSCVLSGEEKLRKIDDEESNKLSTEKLINYRKFFCCDQRFFSLFFSWRAWFIALINALSSFPPRHRFSPSTTHIHQL